MAQVAVVVVWQWHAVALVDVRILVRPCCGASPRYSGHGFGDLEARFCDALDMVAEVGSKV